MDMKKKSTIQLEQQKEALKISTTTDGPASPFSSHAESISFIANSSRSMSVVTKPSTIYRPESVATLHSVQTALDPATLFPYSNKPHETRKKTIEEESKQWESLFDPQYTFGSFQHGIAKPVQHHFYRGKWPLDQEDIIGKVKRNDNEPAQVLFPSVPSPTLPNLEQLQLHISSCMPQENKEDQAQIEILPRPSTSQFPKYRQSENQDVYKKRLDLLNSIQLTGFNKELNDGTQDLPYKLSATARIHKHIKKKAEKIKKETLVDSSTEEEEESEVEEAMDDASSNKLQVAIEPDTLFMSFDENRNINQEQPLPPLEEEDAVSVKYNASLASLDDYENISFHAPKDGDMEKIAEKPTEIEIKRKNRPSFLYFAYGFLFPPLWIIGALYVPSSRQERTTASKRIDKKWKKYSRNALFAFLTTVITIIVLLVVLAPQAVGFRNSSEEGYLEDRVVFDEDPINTSINSVEAIV